MPDGALKAFDRLEDKYIALEKKYKRLREKNKAETRELEKARGALKAITAAFKDIYLTDDVTIQKMYRIAREAQKEG